MKANLHLFLCQTRATDKTPKKPFSSGFVRSIEGFEPKVDLQVVNGVDWFYIDADKGHARVNVKAIAKDDQDVVRGS